MNNKYYLKELTEKNIKEVFGYEYKNFMIEKDLNREVLTKLGMTYAIVYNYDSVITNYISDIDLDYKNMIEARFFNNDAEIRIFSDDDSIKGTIFKEDEDCKSITNNYILYPRYGEKSQNKKYSKELIIKKYIEYDDDNQAYISYVKPSKLIFTGGVDE